MILFRDGRCEPRIAGLDLAAGVRPNGDREPSDGIDRVADAESGIVSLNDRSPESVPVVVPPGKPDANSSSKSDCVVDCGCAARSFTVAGAAALLRST